MSNKNKIRLLNPESDELYSEPEKVRLGSLLEEISEKSTKSGQHPVLSSTTKGLVLQSEHFTKEVASKDNTGYKIVRSGQIVLSPQNLWMGNINFNSRFEVGIVSPSYRIFNISDKCDKQYMAQLIRTRHMLNEFSNASEQGASIVRRNLDMGLFNLIPVELPSLAEQEKIAGFFSALDERIALTADKVKLLKEQKRGYLQRVFNGDMAFTDDNGDKYPAWEQKKLGEIAVVIMGQSPDGKSYSEDSNDMILIQGNADMKKGYIVPRIYTSAPTKTCAVGDIIMSVRAPVGAFAKTDIAACLGRGVCSISANDYVYQYLKYHSSTGGWSKLSQGSTFEAVSSVDVKTLSIPFPSLPEQKKIAEFFSALDEQIELTENKLSLLKEQKKGYLQGIFG